MSSLGGISAWLGFIDFRLQVILALAGGLLPGSRLS